jgi:single-stranded-DNA-specific exonuclease
VKLVERDVPPRTAWALEQAGVAPLLARLLAARGVREAAELDENLAQLLPPSGPNGLKGLPEAARLLADAIQRGERLVIVADYDCDGATACAVMLRGLRLLGARPEQLGYVVPDRAARPARHGGQRHRQPGRRGACARPWPEGAGHGPPPAGAR